MFYKNHRFYTPLSTFFTPPPPPPYLSLSLLNKQPTLYRCAPCDSSGTGPGWEDMTALLDGAANNEGVAISFEPPNPSIHTFGGTVTTNKGTRAACGASELCLRGAVLRNTK